MTTFSNPTLFLSSHRVSRPAIHLPNNQHISPVDLSIYPEIGFGLFRHLNPQVMLAH